MKIGIDARLWRETGVGRYIRALVNNLKEIDKRNQYFLFLLDYEYNHLKLPDNFYKVKAQISWHSLEEQIKMPLLLQKYDLNLIHIPYFSVPIFVHGPFIFTLHDLTISHFATGRASSRSLPIYLFKRLAYKLVLQTAIYRAHKIIVPSRTVKKQLISEYVAAAKKVVVIYESGELEVTGSSAKVNETNYLLYVGNAHPHKNLEKLVAAFQLLRNDLPDLFLVLIGKEDYFYKRLRQELKSRNLSDKIKIYTQVDNSSLGGWYKNALCLVFPSLSEGFGIPGLEAMWHKCPIAVSDIEVFHEIYQNAAIYFNPHNEFDIAQKIKHLINNQKLRQQLIERGQAKAKEYSWRRMTIETLQTYESCLSL